MKNTYYLIIAAVNLITSCQSKKKDVVDDINIIRNIYTNEIVIHKSNPVK